MSSTTTTSSSCSPLLGFITTSTYYYLQLSINLLPGYGNAKSCYFLLNKCSVLVYGRRSSTQFTPTTTVLLVLIILLLQTRISTSIGILLQKDNITYFQLKLKRRTISLSPYVFVDNKVYSPPPRTTRTETTRISCIIFSVSIKEQSGACCQ